MSYCILCSLYFAVGPFLTKRNAVDATVGLAWPPYSAKLVATLPEGVNKCSACILVPERLVCGRLEAAGSIVCLELSGITCNGCMVPLGAYPPAPAAAGILLMLLKSSY